MEVTKETTDWVVQEVAAHFKKLHEDGVCLQTMDSIPHVDSEHPFDTKSMRVGDKFTMMGPSYTRRQRWIMRLTFGWYDPWPTGPEQLYDYTVTSAPMSAEE